MGLIDPVRPDRNRLAIRSLIEFRSLHAVDMISEASSRKIELGSNCGYSPVFIQKVERRRHEAQSLTQHMVLF